MTDRMMKPPFLVRLEISNFRFAIGGEHYYGKFSVATKYTVYTRESGGKGLRSLTGYGTPSAPAGDGAEVTRRMSETCAAYLNKKDDTDLWEAGMDTGRFDDEDSLILAARAQFKDHFDPDRDILVMDDPESDDPADADLILSAPEPFRTTLQTADYEGQRDILMRAGYTCVNPEELNDN